MQRFKFRRLTPRVRLSYLAILSDTILWLLPASPSAEAATGPRLANQTPALLSLVCSAEETREEFGRNGEISSPPPSLPPSASLCSVLSPSPPRQLASGGFSPRRVDAVPSQAEQPSAARRRFLLGCLCSDTFECFYLFILFCSCLVFCCLFTEEMPAVSSKEACGRALAAFTVRACAHAQASEHTLSCPTLCLTQARLPGVVKLNASQMNTDETSTPGRSREPKMKPKMHIVSEFCFAVSPLFGA